MNALLKQMLARPIRLGTRGSELARWQTGQVVALLQKAWPQSRLEEVIIHTKGDKILDKPLPLIGGKGLFTAELEAALRQGEIDFAVHSLKDLPTENPPGLTLGAILTRENPADVLVSRGGHTLTALPQGATVGTSSRRRGAQIRYLRPDIQLADIRGNVGTRLRKALDPQGPYDAIVLAYAGLIRLGRQDVITQILPVLQMVPAPGQGAMAVQCRPEEASLALLAPLQDEATVAAVTAERAFLSALGGGCSVPIGAYAQVADKQISLMGRVAGMDGRTLIEAQGEDDIEMASELGRRLAERVLAQGAAAILEAAVE